MKLQIRFLLLLLVLFVLLLAGLWLHERMNAVAIDRLRTTLVQERQTLVDRIVSLTGNQLRLIADDYSPWDELLRFAAKPDLEWARSNLATGLDPHDVDALWVFQHDLVEAYGVVRHDRQDLRPFPYAADQLRQLTAQARNLHFFAQTSAGLLEFRGAPIRPSDQQQIISASHGWLFVARRWEDRYLRQLESLLGGTIAITTGQPPVSGPAEVVTAKSLPDWQGRPLRELRSTFTAPALLQANAKSQTDLLFIFLFGLISLVAFSVAIQVWVARPLQHLETSLKKRNAHPLAPLLAKGGEFGDLSRIIEESFQQEDKLRQIFAAFNAIDDAVFIADSADGRITHVNSGALRLLGYAAGELLGRTLTDLKVVPTDAREDSLWLRCRDGRLVEVEARAQSLPTSLARQLSVTVARDVSDRRRLEQQRVRAQRLESIGTLAGGIAHDLNNMLTPISLIIEQMQLHREVPSPEILAGARQYVRRSASMLRRLLAFGRDMDGERHSLSIARLCDEIHQVVADTFPKSITLRLETPSQPWSVSGDPSQLHQALLNLMVNARDAMPHGGEIHLRASNVTLDEEAAQTWPEIKAGHYVQFEVADTGCGISPQNMERLFEPFFTTKPLDKSAGLGLSTTLGIVQSHRGSIRVTSEPGQGSTFRFIIPALTQETTVAVAKPAAAAHGTGRTVLVVEDEELIRSFVTNILPRFSLEVLAAANGQEGLALFKQHRDSIGLVISDIQMPIMDGLTMLRHIRGQAPALPVIAMSGRLEPQTRASLSQLGQVTMINKPFELEDFKQAVRTALG